MTNLTVAFQNFANVPQKTCPGVIFSTTNRPGIECGFPGWDADDWPHEGSRHYIQKAENGRRTRTKTREPDVVTSSRFVTRCPWNSLFVEPTLADFPTNQTTPSPCESVVIVYMQQECWQEYYTNPTADGILSKPNHWSRFESDSQTYSDDTSSAWREWRRCARRSSKEFHVQQLCRRYAAILHTTIGSKAVFFILFSVKEPLKYPEKPLPMKKIKIYI